MISKAHYLSLTDILCELPIFYQGWFMDIIGIEWDAWIEEKENYVAVFPFYKEKKYIFQLSRPVAPIMPYYGPYIHFKYNNNDNVAFTKKIIDNCLNAIPRFSELYLTPHFSLNGNSLINKNFTQQKRVTHILDLRQNKDELWNGLDYMRQKNIKKAGKTLRIQKDDFNIDLYFDWIQQTYKKRNETLTHSIELYNKFYLAVTKNNATIANTYYDKDNQPVAMSLCLKDKNYAYSILGANNPTIKNSAATTALLWEAIMQAQNEGCKYFDFEGSNIPGVAEFFKKFGSQRIDYSAWHTTPSYLWKLKKILF